MKKDNEKQEFKIKIKTIKPVLLVIALGAALFFVIKVISFIPDFYNEKIKGKEGTVTTITTSNLEKIIRKNQLYTAAYPYNGYAAVKTDDGTIKYYVAYEGTVKAGIDVTKIEVKEVNEETGTITIQLPEVQIEDPNINAGTLEFIFNKDKYETETVAEEAYRKAQEDLAIRVSTDSDIRTSAAASAKSIIKALVEPWVSQTNSEKQYTVTVLEYGE